jgi:nucleotidyltransferase/DNA polymerase involved in DNA repair
MGRSLTSQRAVCCWIPLFALRCEEARRPELKNRPTALLAPDTTRRLWQVSREARHAGVKTGITVSQAIGLCHSLTLLEPDPVHYEMRFEALIQSLHDVSPVVEGVELGRAYVGADGLEGLYGGPEQQVEAILRCVVRGAWLLRLGWGRGKFVASAAAMRADTGGAVIVRDGEEAAFLATQPLAVLPIDPDTYRRLRQLGLRTLGDLSSLPEDAVVSQFGGDGRRLWRLAAGRISDPVEGRELPEPIVVSLTFYTPVSDRALLVRTMGQLVDRALAHPRRVGWRVQVVKVRGELEHGASWLVGATLKDPSADREDLMAPLETRLEQSPPPGAIERLTVEFTGFAPGTVELQLFARDAAAAARAERRRALRSAAQEIRTRLQRTMLYHVIEVQPWSRLPERRYALIDFEY